MYTIADCKTTAICPDCGHSLNLFRETQMYRCTECLKTYSKNDITPENIKGNIFKVSILDVPANIVYDLDSSTKNKVTKLQNNLDCQVGLCGWNPATCEYSIGFMSKDGNPVIPDFNSIWECVSPIITEQDKEVQKVSVNWS